VGTWQQNPTTFLLRAMKKFAISLALLLTVSYPVTAKEPKSQKPIIVESPSECVAQAIKNEAGGEDYEGQVAIAWVIRNRLESGKFPGSPCRIVYEKHGLDCQFTFICFPFKPIDEDKNRNDFYSIAMMVLYSTYMIDPTEGALYFNNKPFKNKGFKFIKKIGNHYFYKDAN
jgi:spore germination cell wall hydrolase CwlJ-like protein